MKCARGFTLWELMVVIALVVFLVLAAIENLLPLRGDAERAAFVSTSSHLASAIGLESVRRVLESGAEGLLAMEGMNPVEALVAPMNRYEGVVQGGNYSTLAPGHWGFDDAAGLLVYRVRYPEYTTGGHGSLPVVRFRVVVERDAGGSPGAVNLRQLDAITWETNGSQLLRWLGANDE